jgi:hypothetical protein
MRFLTRYNFGILRVDRQATRRSAIIDYRIAPKARPRM